MQGQRAENLALERAASYLHDGAWVAEQKLDGHRVMMQVIDGVPTALNRRGEPYGNSVHRLILGEFRSRAFAGEWLFDGELLGNTYHVFDLLVAPTGTLIDQPWFVRRGALEAVITAWQPTHTQLVQTAYTLQEKRELLATVTESLREGIMLKLRTAPYRPGRKVESWLKVKLVKTADCIISEVGREGKCSIALEVYHDATGKRVPVGACTMSGANLRRAHVGDVVEIRYLNLGNGGRLFQPAFLRFRYDKLPMECLVSQLIGADRTVIA